MIEDLSSMKTTTSKVWLETSQKKAHEAIAEDRLISLCCHQLDFNIPSGCACHNEAFSKQRPMHDGILPFSIVLLLGQQVWSPAHHQNVNSHLLTARMFLICLWIIGPTGRDLREYVVIIAKSGTWQYYAIWLVLEYMCQDLNHYSALGFKRFKNILTFL